MFPILILMKADPATYCPTVVSPREPTAQAYLMFAMGYLSASQ